VTDDPLETAKGMLFQKVSGGGNDFVLLDNRNGRLRGDLSGLVRRVCHRGLGVGADGLILVQWSEVADLRMVYFNRDGGPADLCGNGVRCVARWAAATNFFPRRLRIETGAGVLEADGASEPPWFRLPLGRVAAEQVALVVRSEKVKGVRVRAGVPHLVLEVEDPLDPRQMEIAPFLRSHPQLGAEGANIDFFSMRGEGRAEVSHFERGVEAETFSSGTGSIAVAVAARQLGRCRGPLVCRNRLGLESRVALAESPAGLEATLAGDARLLFQARLTDAVLLAPGAAEESPPPAGRSPAAPDPAARGRP
jgi:diaminopimelate epimerase